MSSVDITNKISDKWVNDIQETIFDKIDEEIMSVLTITERNMIKEETAKEVRQEILNKISEDEAEYNKEGTSILDKSKEWTMDYLADLDKIVIYNLFDDMATLVNRLVKDKLLDDNKEITLETLRNRVTFNKLVRRGKLDVEGMEDVVDKLNLINLEGINLSKNEIKEIETEMAEDIKYEFVIPWTEQDLENNERILLSQGRIKPNSTNYFFDAGYTRNFLLETSSERRETLRKIQLDTLARIRKFGPASKEDAENYNKYFEMIGFEEEKIDIPKEYFRLSTYDDISRPVISNRDTINITGFVNAYLKIAPILHFLVFALAMFISEGKLFSFMSKNILSTIIVVIAPKIAYNYLYEDYRESKYVVNESSLNKLFDMNNQMVISDMDLKEAYYLRENANEQNMMDGMGLYLVADSLLFRIAIPIILTFYFFH